MKLEEVRKQKIERNYKVLENLRNIDINIENSELDLFETKVPGRPHIAKLMVEKKYVSSMNEAFLKYLGNGKIENLNSAIGINEKFLFTNELFEGNTEQFLKTIDDLNNCVSLSEAKDKLTAIAQKRSWELEEEPYQKLELLLSRKYQ